MTAGMSTSTLSHKCHKEEMFSEVNFTILSRELRQLPTNDKKGYSEPILRITDRAMSSQQVVIHNTAGDSYELFPTCHSLCSAASVCPSNCSPVDFTLAPTAGFLADLPGRFLLAIICGHFEETKRRKYSRGNPETDTVQYKKQVEPREAKYGYTKTTRAIVSMCDR